MAGAYQPKALLVRSRTSERTSLPRLRNLHRSRRAGARLAHRRLRILAILIYSGGSLYRHRHTCCRWRRGTYPPLSGRVLESTRSSFAGLSTALKIRKLNLDPFNNRASTSAAGPGAISATTFSCSAPARHRNLCPGALLHREQNLRQRHFIGPNPQQPVAIGNVEHRLDGTQHADRLRVPGCNWPSDELGTTALSAGKPSAPDLGRRPARIAHHFNDDRAPVRETPGTTAPSLNPARAAVTAASPETAPREHLSLLRDPPTGCVDSVPA